MVDAAFPPKSGSLARVTRPVAIVRLEPAQLSETCGVHFRSGHDDLDRLQWAEIAGTRGRTYALVRHQHSPRPGTEVLISSASTDPADDLKDALNALGLELSDVAWMHPEVVGRPDSPR